MKSVFLDTYCLIAASLQREPDHARATQLLAQLEAKGTNVVSTDAVLIEFGNALARVQLRERASATLRLIETRPQFEIVHVTREIYDRARSLYSTRLDKAWGMTDCISFEVMRERKIRQALTADAHFAQAGFECMFD
jgi:uncharacterized protein